MGLPVILLLLMWLLQKHNDNKDAFYTNYLATSLSESYCVLSRVYAGVCLMSLDSGGNDVYFLLSTA